MPDEAYAQTPIGWMGNLFYVFAMVISFAILVISGKTLWRRIRNHSSRDVGKAFQFFTLKMLIAAAVMFLPVYCLQYPFGEKPNIIRSVLLSIHNAMRLCVLDGEFDFIRDNITRLNSVVHIFFSTYAAFLYLLAPVIFSFTIFLSVFRNAFEWVLYLIHRKAPLYLFSCLNEESAAMAQSILEERSQNEETAEAHCLIVFCNIPRDEKELEKLSTAFPTHSKNNTIVLSTADTITDFKIDRFQNEITFFLMDRNEAKNIEDASLLCNALKSEPENSQSNPPPRRVYVYASSSASGPLIDALSQKVSVPESTVQSVQEMIHTACSGSNAKVLDPYDMTWSIRDEISKKDLPFYEPFSIMRIDSERQMAMQIVQEINDADNYTTIKEGTESVTITLLGLGGIGKEMLESILWTYQNYGCKLIINVFDETGKENPSKDETDNPLYQHLSCKWPELMETNKEWRESTKAETAHPDTESEYDIQFFLGTDCFSKQFREYFEKPETQERLMQSTLVICALGDDDKNLKAALMMRQIFAGRSPESSLPPDCPDIYAVVYDNQKAENFSGQAQITNYKEEPFHISICGSMKSQYNIQNIRLIEKMEQEALVYHIDWFWTINETEDEKNILGSTGAHGKAKNLEDELNKYIHYEYYRRSSLAKAVHKKSLEKRGLFTPETLRTVQEHDPNNNKCRCEICKARITEHMRWNAFMRVNGYRHGEKRNDMAKIHPCLKAWNKMPLEERVKD